MKFIIGYTTENNTTIYYNSHGFVTNNINEAKSYNDAKTTLKVMKYIKYTMKDYINYENVWAIFPTDENVINDNSMED
jgi:hypothetical protein